MFDYGGEEARIAWELSPEPGWLQSQYGQLFYWYHPPREVSRDVAVLLCDPLGSDRMNLHLSYRHLALRLSYLGFPVLRIDYPGTCDSSGTPRDPARLQAYDGALRTGADYLKERSGLTRLSVFGARFGGTMAIRFAAENEDVSLIGVWGAYRSGREFLRNERAIERMSGANPEQRRPSLWAEGDMESLGYFYRADTVEALGKIEYSEPVERFCDHACVFTWDSFSKDQQIAQWMENSGAQVKLHTAALDPAEASLKEQRVPNSLIDEMDRWLIDHSCEIGTPTESTVTPKASYGNSVATNRLLIQSNHGQLVEQSIRLGANSELFGILTEAAESVRNGKSILLVNGGNNHRVGINRNYVEWARLWASLGFSVLRIDIKGLGDSPPRRAAQLNELYLDETLDDLTEAVNWLSKKSSNGKVILCGLCAGAYQSLHFTRSDDRVEAAIFIELLRFYRNETSHKSLRTGISGRLARRLERYRRSILSSDGNLAEWVKRIARSGKSMLVIYRQDEQMLDAFRKEVGSAISAEFNHSERLKLHLLESSNHIFSPMWSQQKLTSVLTGYLEEISSELGREIHQ